LSGSYLTTANVTVGPLSGFTFCSTSGGTYSASISLTPNSGNLNQVVYVKFNPTLGQSYNGNIPISGGGASSITVAVTGSGVSTPPTMNSTPSISSIGTTSAVLGGNITAIGCTNVIERGIYYSTISGFTPPGQGTKVSESSGPYSSGAFTEAVTGLSQGTVYYFKSFATNSGGTSYSSSQGTFTSGCSINSGFPWSENFDAMASIGSSIVPTCWKVESGSGAPWYSMNAAGVSYNDPSSSPNYIVVNYSPITTDKYLITPGFNLTAGGSYIFSFKYVGDAYDGWTADARTNTSQTGAGSTLLGTAFLTSGTITSTTYTTITRTFTPATSGVSYFMVRVNNNSTPWYLGFDDFKVEAVYQPPTSISSSLVAGNKTHISWIAPSSVPSNGYEWEIRTSGAAGSGVVGLTRNGSTSGLSIDVDSLSPITNYSFYIRSNYGGGNYSTYSNAYSLVPAPTGSSAQSFCNSATIANLTVTGSSIKWYDAAYGGNLLVSTTSLINGNTYYASQTVGGSESNFRFAVTVNIPITPTPSGDATQIFCSSTTIASLIVNGSAIKWYNAPTGGSLLLNTDTLVIGRIYYASQTIAGCESQSRLSVKTTTPAGAIAVVTTPVSNIGLTSATFNGQLSSTCFTPSISKGFVFANHNHPALGDALSTAISSGVGTGVYTYVDTILSSATDYWVRAYCLNALDTFYGDIVHFKTGIWPYFNLELRNDAQVSPTEYQFDIYVVHTGNYANPPNFELSLAQIGIFVNDSIRNGGTLVDSLIMGSTSEINLNQRQTQANMFMTNSTPNKCIKITGTSVSAGLGTIISKTSGTKLMRVRLINSVPFAMAQPNLSIVPTNATGLNYPTKVYSFIGTSSTNISANGTFITSTLNNPTLNLPTVTGGGNYCTSGAPAVVGTSGSQVGINYQLKKDGVNYGTVVAGNGSALSWNITEAGTYTCLGGSTMLIGNALVTVSSTNAPLGDSLQTFSFGSTISNLLALGSSLKWYDAANGGNLLLATTLLTNGSHYYATQSIGGCESNTRLKVTTIILRKVNLHFFLQGLFNSTTISMFEAQDVDLNSGLSFAKYGNGIADKVDVELHNGFAPYNLVLKISNVDLTTDGFASFNLDPIRNGNYFIKITNRNHLETWSAYPVSFTTNPVSYDFVSNALNAYQVAGGIDPQIQVYNGVYAFYLGDLDQSLGVDFDDFNLFEPYLNNGIYGFTIADFSGNGLVDFDDFNLFEPRLNEGPYSQYPGMAKK
ncbi:MAG: hypothetical protein WCH34_06155, partial [Bacteroidota bacterium]